MSSVNRGAAVRFSNVDQGDAEMLLISQGWSSKHPSSQGDLLKINQESSWALYFPVKCFSASMSHLLIWCGSAVVKGVETLKTSSISTTMWSSFPSWESAVVRIPWRAECVWSKLPMWYKKRQRCKPCFLSRCILIRFFPENRPLVLCSPVLWCPDEVF